jgi:glyoxylase-like metal-dependent hydrolase (beta-lactamase superfamily II)
VDHIRGVGPVAAGFAIPVYISAADRRLYESPHNALLPWLAAAEGLPQSQDAPVLLAGLGPAVISTPGHTPGSVCFHFAGAGVLFSGDTLFAGSVGRTDLPGGDSEALLSSIRSRLLVLPPGTSVLPGHGPPTTIGEETRTNPFL